MGRAPCCSKVGLNRGRWTTEEDEILSKYIQTHGEGSWRELPINAGLLRCGKSCRLRWINYLRSGLKRGKISAEEEELIIRLHTMLGNRWSMIAGRMPGRTDNDIKNYWNTHLSKKLAVQGIDPMTNKPFYYNASFEKKSEKEQEDVSSSIESSIFLNQTKKSKEIKKSMKKTPLGTRKRNTVAASGHLKKKIANMEQVSSRISNHSSSESACSEIEDSSHPNEAEPSSSGKLQPQGCNILVQNSDDKSKFLLRHEYPTSSLTMNSSCLWEESFPSKMLPSDVDFFGSVDTTELMTFENQLPDPSPAADEYNGNIETGDLWSLFLSDVKE